MPEQRSTWSAAIPNSGRGHFASRRGEKRSTRSAAIPNRMASWLALTAILAGALAAPAEAAARSFTAEVIVFDDLRGEGLHAEHWPAEPGAPPFRAAIEIAPRPGGTANDVARMYRAVAPSQLRLGGVWNRLRRSAHYRPLLHAGWRVPGVPRRTARAVRLGTGPGEDASEAADGMRVAPPQPPEQPEQPERPLVHGTVTISLARFLQVEIDLLYHRPANGDPAPPDSMPTRFRLVAERRMRSGELHYIDHPLFGVLILITPV